MTEENKFDQIESNEELPASHKSAVLKTISTAMLIGNITELFTRDYAKVSGSILSSEEESDTTSE